MHPYGHHGIQTSHLHNAMVLLSENPQHGHSPAGILEVPFDLGIKVEECGMEAPVQLRPRCPGHLFLYSSWCAGHTSPVLIQLHFGSRNFAQWFFPWKALGQLCLSLAVHPNISPSGDCFLILQRSGPGDLPICHWAWTH